MIKMSLMTKTFSKSCLAFAFTFFFGVVWSQSNPDSQLKYIDILPPSPGVAKIADHSRPDVGMCSGTAQFHLPITSLDMGTINIPIGLNYSSNGVKVDAISSRVGVDFQLEAGGAITRTVKGSGPDELSKMLNLPNDHSIGSRPFIDFVSKVSMPWTQGGYDAEPDMFSYSYCGTGGKFILDSAKNTYQIPKTNAKIVTNFSGTDWNFKISDDKGNDYYFGGTGYTEVSKRYQGCSPRSNNFGTTTAWFLQKIILYNGDQVTFNYLPTNYRYDIGVSQTDYYQLPSQSQPMIENDCAVCPVNRNSVCVTYIDVNTYYLSSIVTTRGQSITLGYAPRKDCGDSLLTRVVKNFNGTAVESFKLNYSNYVSTNLAPTSLAISGDIHNRYFLNSVTKLFNGNYINEYVMSYNAPASLPTRLTFAQDHWGYFNGKYNTTLIPKPATLELINKFPLATADREPDTLQSKKGLLTKIQYATGGYDSITYQSNTVYESRTIYPTVSTLIDGIVVGADFSTKATSVIGTMTIGFGQYVRVDLRVTNLGEAGCCPTQQQNGFISISNGSSTPAYFGAPAGDANGPLGETDQTIWFEPGTYTITLSASGSVSHAEVMITYVPGVPQVITKNWTTGGSRVSQIVTKSFDGSFVGKKKYSYNAAGSTNSSAVKNYEINYYKGYSYTLWCWQRPGGWNETDAGMIERSRDCSYGSMFSTSLGNLFNPSGNSVSYSFVSESFDDTKTNGVIEHTFSTNPDTNGNALVGFSAIGVNPSNTSVFLNGRETVTALYKNTESALQLIQKTTNYYGWANGLYDVLVGCIVNRFYDTPTVRTGPVQPDEIAPLECTDYFLHSPWITLDSVKVDEYGPSGEYYTTTTKYGYDNSTLLPSTISTIDSYGLKHVTNNYYAGMSTVPGAASDQSTLFSTMSAKNNIGQLVYQQKLVNNKQVSSNRIILGQTDTSSPVLPKEVKQTNTTTGVEESLFTVTKYDAHGNIQERKNRDGVTHSFRWNYFDKYPVAETIGSTFSDMDATSFEGDNFGGWAFNNLSIDGATAYTGHQSYTLSGSNQISHTGLSASQTYVVSFWANSGNTIKVNGLTPTTGVTRKGWIYHEVRLATNVTSITINGAGQIDELRLCPSSASMTTYAYDPEIGMTSATDANNVTTFYEYDGLKRLITVRDDQNKILKTNKYQYYDPSKPLTPHN